MKSGTHHFDILECVTCWRNRICLQVDVRHIAPIVNSITGTAGRNICIAKDEIEYVGAIDDSFEVIDLCFVRRIPRAIDASAVLLHSWKFGRWPNERKVSQVHCRPESDEKEKSSGVSVRHGSFLIAHEIQGSFKGASSLGG